MGGNNDNDELLEEFERALREQEDKSSGEGARAVWPPPVEEAPGRGARDTGKRRGDFAGLLSDVELPAVASKPDPKASVSTRSPRKSRKTGGRELTPEQAMAEVFDSLGGERAIHAKKFSGAGTGLSDEVEVRYHEPAPVEEPVAGTIQEDATRDDLLFLEEMAAADVDRIRQRWELRDKSRVEGAAWFTVDQISRLTAEELMEPSITPEQRTLLKRSRRARMRALNIRMMRRPEARGQVDALVRDAIRSDERFVRIITGKGKNSPGEPVLKRMVIEWVEAAASVRGWAPETDRSGNYGSIVVELRKKGASG